MAKKLPIVLGGKKQNQIHTSTEQNRNPKINSHLYGQLSYNKGGWINNGESAISSINSVGKIGQPHGKEWKTETVPQN